MAGLPARRITAFPYSLTSHPMILGNVAAFGGTLINAALPRSSGGRWRACMSSSTSDCSPWSWPGRSVAAPSGSAAASSWAAPCSAPSSSLQGEPHEHHRYDRRGTNRRPVVSRRFPATIGRFDAPADRAAIDGLVRWVEERYAEDLAKRPSKHVYVGTLPAAVVAEIDHLRDSPIIRDLIARQVPAGSTIAPMKHTDELYLSHYNKDRGGDQGLFDKHYDGNLRFLASSIVVRALIYLQSDDTYKVVFDDSRVEKAFTTYEFGLLDFHRELHWVEGAVQPGRPPAHPAEVQLSCNAARRRRRSGGPRSPPTPPCSTS